MTVETLARALRLMVEQGHGAETVVLRVNVGKRTTRYYHTASAYRLNLSSNSHTEVGPFAAIESGPEIVKRTP